MRFLIFITFALSSSILLAKEHTIIQQNKSFVGEKEVTASLGDTINFLNSDPFSHNIFSLSDTQAFDLGSYPKGESRSIQLTKKGTIDIECAIHPQMQMKIHVK